MKLSVFNSITIVKNIDIDTLRYSLSLGYNAPRISDIKIENKLNYREAIAKLYPIVDTRRNQFLVFTSFAGSLFLICNSTSGSAASITGPLPNKFNAETIDGFINYPTQIIDQYQNNLYVSPIEHFFLQVKDNVGVSRTITLILQNHSRHFYSNFGELYNFEDPADYSGLENGIVPSIDVLWKFANHFGWPSPRSIEFLDNVKKCELITFPPIEGLKERFISDEIQQRILKLPPAWQK